MSKNNSKKIDITLRNFLGYLLCTKDDFANELSKEYSIEERNIFIYNLCNKYNI